MHEDQSKMLAMKEIDSKLQYLVPKLNEINCICSELKKDDYFYEPVIENYISSSGQPMPTIVVRAYPNRANRDKYNALDLAAFEDVYFGVNEIYNDFQRREPDELDDFVIENEEYRFGLVKEHDWILIGNVYYFLFSVVNLTETHNDESPIIDNKGNIKGRVTYSVYFEALDLADH